MAKASKRFICRTCGAVHPKWMGRCPDCGEWDALEEHQPLAAGAASDRQRGAGEWSGGEAPQATPIAAADDALDQLQRLASGIAEFDRVLGGAPGSAPGSAPENAPGNEVASENDTGLVPGSAVLVGGDPGIGKSTLLLQAAQALAQRGTRVLYVTSEESAHQLRLRANRLALDKDAPAELFVLADTNLARILEQARKTSPGVLIVDSIQMIYKGDLAAAPGSVTQLRSCCMELVYFAKASGCAVLLVGHVTKQGQLAGPRLLEHLVDTVLYFEGDRFHNHRVVRAVKNRFGSTLEVGLFEMTDAGLMPVADGSGLIAAEYRTRSGSVVCPVIQGSRCLLVEVQALTATGFLGSAKRKASGLDGNRLAMLIAVLEKRGGLRLADQDIFASSVGGMKIVEPAADLAIALAIAGTHYNRSLPQKMCTFGEIGLSGEVRHVQRMPQRLAEAARLGFTHVLCPPTKIKPPTGCDLVIVDSVDRAVQMLG
jgi:DNA repair protein RadA/Sms